MPPGPIWPGERLQRLIPLYLVAPLPLKPFFLGFFYACFSCHSLGWLLSGLNWNVTPSERPLSLITLSKMASITTPCFIYFRAHISLISWLIYLFIIFPLDYTIHWASERPSRLSRVMLSYFDFLLPCTASLSCVFFVFVFPPPCFMADRWEGMRKWLAVVVVCGGRAMNWSIWALSF